MHEWIIMGMLAGGFRLLAVIGALIIVGIIAFSEITKVHLLTSTTHIASTRVTHAYDHHYITGDFWVHPSERFMQEDVLVGNDCRVWDDKTWKFCGMMPWQRNPCVYFGVNASQRFEHDLAQQNFTLPLDLIKDFMHMQHLETLPPSDTHHETLANQVKKSFDVCEYESFKDLRMIRNNADSYSIASTHSAVVLMWGVWLVILTCSAMRYKQYFCQYVMTFDASMGYKETAYDMVWFALLLLFFFLGRFMYGDGMAERGSLILPNASFVYVFFAVAWTMFWTRSDPADVSPVEGESPPASVPHPGVSGFLGHAAPSTVPIVASGGQPGGTEINPMYGRSPLPDAIDVSNFAGAQLKTRAYLQAGKTGRYPAAVSITDIDIDLKNSMKDLQTSNYNEVTFEDSRFYIAQLWAVPFTVLALFVFDNGFVMDMDVTVVSILSFVFGVIDMFVCKLRNISGIMRKFGQDGCRSAMNWTLLLVQSVLVLMELFVFITLNMFFQSRVDEQYHAQERNSAMWYFFAFHFGINFFVLVSQGIDVYYLKVSTEMTWKDYTEATWGKLLHFFRVSNLWVFCVWALILVLEANSGTGDIAMGDHMKIFDNDSCKATEVDTAACTLGIYFSNLYQQDSSIWYKAATALSKKRAEEMVYWFSSTNLTASST